jgi:hypothetical protein
MMKKQSWIVVANSTIARVFKLEKLKLTELECLIHPESRLKQQDLVSDKAGRTNESMFPSRSAMEQENSPKKVEAILFA